MNFHVGQRVLCVNDAWHPNHTKSYARPVCGRQYTIRDVLMWLPDTVHVRLVECVNPIRKWDDGDSSEVAFLAARFRPLIERSTETGMAILRKVADNAAKRRELIGLD